MHTSNRIKGLAYAVTSSATFGLAPFFTLGLLAAGLSPFEVLSYRWGVAAAALIAVGLTAGCRFRLARRDIGVVLLLSLLRAATSLSLVIAYSNIASGAASTIHFMYPLVVAAAMMLFFRENRSGRILFALAISIAGAVLLSGNAGNAHGGDTTLGVAAACVSVITYGGYIVGVKNTRAAQIESTTLTGYVMAIGAILFLIGGCCTGGVRVVTTGTAWLYILGLALPATAISNMTLVRAIQYAGPTLTSICGAMEPLTAVAIGVWLLGEPFTLRSAAGIALIVAAVSLIVVRTARSGQKSNQAADAPANSE